MRGRYLRYGGAMACRWQRYANRVLGWRRAVAAVVAALRHPRCAHISRISRPSHSLPLTRGDRLDARPKVAADEPNRPATGSGRYSSTPHTCTRHPAAHAAAAHRLAAATRAATPPLAPHLCATTGLLRRHHQRITRALIRQQMRIFAAYTRGGRGIATAVGAGQSSRPAPTSRVYIRR